MVIALRTKTKNHEKNPRLGGRRRVGIDVWLSCAVVAAALFWMIFPQAGGAGALTQNIMEGSLPPFSDGHLFGTDEFGRDILKLTIAGARSALLGPIVIATGSIIIGLLFGALAGWFGGALDWIISRYADLTLSMPSLLLAIVAAGIIGGGYWVSVLVMIVLYSPFDIRLVRSAVIAERNKPYIEAALILKMRTLRILARHIFPNVALIVLVNFFLNIGYAIVSMSSLSYLGLGVSPQDADWGRQLSDARSIIFDNTAAILAPGLAIIITATAINILGNYLAERGGNGGAV
ncbi:MAG: ABC transporter permease [Clostridiales Family XIII bacterium]|jgi:peptide/nickel transport system permease protein|nr:ABC transporter permease [Clostridiales Family XIII bacterium]